MTGRWWLRVLNCSACVHVCVCVRTCVCACLCAGPTIWNLNLSVANQLAREEGLCVSVLDERVLQHLYHAKSRLERWQTDNIWVYKNRIYKENSTLRKRLDTSDILLPAGNSNSLIYFLLSTLSFNLAPIPVSNFLCTLPRIAFDIPHHAALAAGSTPAELSYLDNGPFSTLKVDCKLMLHSSRHCCLNLNL